MLIACNWDEWDSRWLNGDPFISETGGLISIPGRVKSGTVVWTAHDLCDISSKGTVLAAILWHKNETRQLL